MWVDIYNDISICYYIVPMSELAGYLIDYSLLVLRYIFIKKQCTIRL